MDFVAVVDQVIALLRQRGRVTYSTLKRQFQLDDAALEDVKNELIEGQRLAVDERGNVLLWAGNTAASAPAPSPPADPARAPLMYTPAYLAEKILTSRSALEGERKQVTVLFADLKGSMELLADRDPEDARQLLDPVLERMMDAVHRYEGTVNQVMGDGIMALFGAPLAHEDHAVRACYAALRMQEAVQQYAVEVQRSHGVPLHIRVGLNAGEVVVRSIGSDLHMDYTAVGQTTHLAARMEQMAMPGSILITPAVLGLVEGFVQVKALGAMSVRGLRDPVETYEVTGAGVVRSRLQAAAARGLTRFVGRQQELETLQQALAQAQAGHGQVVALVGEAGVGKSRLVYECVHSHRTQGWRVLESVSVSYGKATPYFPVIELLKRYCHLKDDDDHRTIRAKVTGQVLTLDETLQDTTPALLALLDALPADSPFLTLDPPQRRRRTLDGLKRLLLRESQVQPLLLVFEDLHWIDAETQALLDSLIESLPTARLLLLVNYRPEYQHGWGNKTYYTQLRLDPLPPASADAFLQALLGDDPSLVPLTQLLIARTEGNPFFLEESVRTLVESGVLVGEPGAYRLAQALPTIQVPATVQVVLAEDVVPGVRCLVYAALTRWCLGYPDQAVRYSEEALAWARELAHLPSVLLVHHFVAFLQYYRRDVPALQAQADALRTVATIQGFPLWAGFGTCWHAWGLAVQGQGAAGLAQMHQGMAMVGATGQGASRSTHLLLLAETAAHAGDLEAGSHCLAEALTACETTGRGNLLAEVYRLQGTVLLRQAVPDVAQAEACFEQALALARCQQAKSWELRAAMSLARLWQQQGKQAEAYELLAPIYGWFTEGFDTADLQDAKALLEELAG